MFETLKAMIKEEWRIHSLVFGNRSFSFFPLLLALLSFIASALIPLYRVILTGDEMAGVLHGTYLFFGLSVGGFGVLGREALNRRLGDISLIAYSARTLPISEKRLFADFVAKDTLFYILFLVAPFIAGYLGAALIFGFSLAQIPYLAVSLTLTFLFGLATCFLATTAYAHLGKKFLLILGAAAFACTLADPAWLQAENLMGVILPLQYFLHGRTADFIASSAFILIASAASTAFVKLDYRLATKRFQNKYSELEKRLRPTGYSLFLAKDLLDLERSEGGIWKVFGSYVFPILAAGVTVLFFARFLPIGGHHILLLIALMTGLTSTSLYSFLAEYDFPQLYEFLPITTPYIIKAKLIVYAFFTACAATMIIAATYILFKPPILFLPVALAFAAGVAAYTTSVTVYLTGLRPNVMLYSAGIFIRYMLATAVPLLIPSILYMTGLAGEKTSMLIALAYTLVMLPAAALILQKSYVKWAFQAL